MVFSQHILVRMHPPLREAVRAAADRAGLSVSELVRRTIHREIADPAAKDMPSSTAVAPGSALTLREGGPLALVAAAIVSLTIVAGSRPASAQSAPNWSYGYTPTAGEVRAAFQSKQDRLTFTPLSQAGGAMGGKLTAAPATVNGAGFGILPGVAPTSGTDGDLWITAGGLFARIGGRAVQFLTTASIGTLAPQNASAVAITGGTIDGTAIGGKVPAAGAFTSLSASTPLPLTSGGTGAATATAARAALGAAASGANADILSLAGLTTPLSAAQGGTGFSSLSAALDGLSSAPQGSILYRGPTAWVSLPPGSSGQVLTTNGAGANPGWVAPSTGSLSGASVGYSRVATAAVATTTVQTPINDAPPTTGTTAPITSVNHTPKSASNLLHVRAVLQASLSTTGAVIGSIFQGSGTNAVATRFASAMSGYSVNVVTDYWTIAGTTSPITFSLGAGSNNSATLTVNGVGGGRLFGGTMLTSIEVTETAP